MPVLHLVPEANRAAVVVVVVVVVVLVSLLLLLELELLLPELRAFRSQEKRKRSEGSVGER